jgi:hypothetical protein
MTDNASSHRYKAFAWERLMLGLKHIRTSKPNGKAEGFIQTTSNGPTAAPTQTRNNLGTSGIGLYPQPKGMGLHGKGCVRRAVGPPNTHATARIIFPSMVLRLKRSERYRLRCRMSNVRPTETFNRLDAIAKTIRFVTIF